MLYLAGVSDSEVGSYQTALSRLASEEIESQLRSAGLNPARFAVFSPQTSPLRAIEQAAQRLEPDLVVVGSSRFPLLKRVFVGSVSNEVLRNVKHDVLLVSPAEVRRARRRAPRSPDNSASSAQATKS